ncbi:MAG: hypothetical protein AAFO87_15960 [Cyanobacteria bacterium J06607_6]
MVSNLYAIQCPDCLPGPGKPSPMRWDLVPKPIRMVLLDAGCLLLKHWTRRHHDAHVRFQYAPMVYNGDLYYLQRWARVEWNVSPSQLLFPHEGWPCTEKTRRDGSHLSLLVREAIAHLYSDAADHASHQSHRSLVNISLSH